MVDSLERQLKRLGFGYDFIWSIISHIRGNSKLEKIITYSGDQGTYDYIVNKLGILDTPGQVFTMRLRMVGSIFMVTRSLRGKRSEFAKQISIII